MIDKYKANMKAAKMLYPNDTFLKDTIRDWQIRIQSDNSIFDIFSNPADCLATVKMLGEKHGIGICPSISKNNYLVLIAGNVSKRSKGVLLSYEEAVSCAIESI